MDSSEYAYARPEAELLFQFAFVLGWPMADTTQIEWTRLDVGTLLRAARKSRLAAIFATRSVSLSDFVG